MCEKLTELEKAMGVFAAGFDPALLSAAQAEGVMERASRIEHMGATVKALAAARMCETELWEQGGDRTPAHMLARRTGQTVSEAAQQLEAAKRLKDHPKTDAAARKGRLSPKQAAAITDAAAADPKAEDDLLDLADRASLGELRDEAARRKAAASDLEERQKKIHAERNVRHWTGPDGAWRLAAYGPPEAGARFMARLQPIIDAIFKKARAEDRREPTEAYAFDALMQLGEGEDAPKGRAGTTKVLVRVDLESLVRGHATDGEVCEIAGFGPVPVSVVEEILARGDTFLAAVLTTGQRVTGVAHLGRRPTAAQVSGLQWLYPTCAVEGCSAPARQWDHREDWSKTHRTPFDGLDGYCCHHHDKKTYDGWALVEGVGKRAFVAPGDPSHPRNVKERERPPPKVAA
ncbi:MAG TPA: DUF222 domain-containing protein [Acidimicrobiales bacterium]|jgi:hypothetical protein|nr:DUF222 domain-containing protein [Acidimicrobiales bacterium]